MTVIKPVSVAAMINRGEWSVLMAKNIMTMPSSTEWLMASLIMAIFRRIRKQPGTAAEVATKHPINMISTTGCISGPSAIFEWLLKPRFLLVPIHYFCGDRLGRLVQVFQVNELAEPHLILLEH